MKNLIYLFSLAAILVLNACGDDCDPGEFGQNLVGIWDTPRIGESEEGTVSFSGDGTGTTSANSVFSAEINGVTLRDFTWNYDSSAEELNISWTATSGSLSAAYSVIEYSCDDITLNFFLNFTITR